MGTFINGGILLIHNIFEQAKTDFEEWNSFLDTEYQKKKKEFIMQIIMPIPISITLFSLHPMNFFILTGIVILQIIYCIYGYRLFAKYMILSELILAEEHNQSEDIKNILNKKCVDFLVRLEKIQWIVIAISIVIIAILFMRDTILLWVH